MKKSLISRSLSSTKNSLEKRSSEYEYEPHIEILCDDADDDVIIQKQQQPQQNYMHQQIQQEQIPHKQPQIQQQKQKMKQKNYMHQNMQQYEGKLPIQYDKNYDLLEGVEQFLEENELYDIVHSPDQMSFYEATGCFLSKLEFNNIRKIVSYYLSILDDIQSIDCGVITKSDIHDSGKKISELKKLSSRYIDV